MPNTSISLPNHSSTGGGLTPLDASTLTGFFEVDDYEFKPVLSSGKAKEYGYQQWLTYVGEEAIIDRLNMVDPSWIFTLDRIEQRGNSFTTYATLTVKGIIRQGVGQGDDEKAAATDSLKRAARLFGVGAHLKRSPKLYTDPGMKRNDSENKVRGDFGRWLAAQSKNVTPSTPPQTPTPAPASGVKHADEKNPSDQNETPVDESAFWTLVDRNSLRDAVLTRMAECHGTMDVRHLTRTQAFDIFNFCADEAKRTTEDDTTDDTQSPDEDTSGKA